MKKLFTLLALLLAFIFTNAQTAEETIEWLKAKKVNIEHNRSSSTTVHEFGENHVDFSVNQLSIVNDKGAWTKFNWYDIKDITIVKTNYYEYISIISKQENTEGINYFIRIGIPDNDFRVKFLKALKKMATLQGAKLVEDDLF